MMGLLIDKPSIWSTDTVDQCNALRSWQEIVDQALMELEIKSPAQQFHAQIEQIVLGPALFSEVRAGPQMIKRTNACIARGKRAISLDLIQVRSGTLSYKHRGYEATLVAGDCVVFDRQRPYSFSSTQTDCILLGIPQDWLGAWAADPETLVGQRLDGSVGWGKALSTMLAQLDIATLDMLALPRGAIADQIAALLVLAGGAVDPATVKQSRRTLERIREVLNDLAHDPELDPARVAMQLGISKRYLHLMFASAGQTFGRQLNEIRLERARAMLANPQFGSVPIGEIAFRCGYADYSRFSKNFRTYFGLSPKQARTGLHPAP